MKKRLTSKLNNSFSSAPYNTPSYMHSNVVGLSLYGMHNTIEFTISAAVSVSMLSITVVLRI